TPRAGALCMKRCTTDAECRADEGYVCDPDWKACLLPNLPSIVPRTCPRTAGPARATAFGPSTRGSANAAHSHHQPEAIVTDEGGVIAIVVSRELATRQLAPGLAPTIV